MICQRPGCNREIPQGRRKYCCSTCSRAVNRQRVLVTAHALRVTTENDNFELKLRSCLSCGAEFLSDGPWNRICPRCKR